MTLSDLKPGQKAQILDVDLDGMELQRLMDMGFIESTKIEMIRNAPLMDPLDVKIKGYMAAIRRDEAKQIEVKLL